MNWPIDFQSLKRRLAKVDVEPLRSRIARDFEPLTSSIARDNPHREQFFQLIRDIKWFILISLLLCVLLYAPDQISELYRVIYANVCWNWHPSWFLSELSSCVDPKGVAATVWLAAAGIGRVLWFYLTIFLVGAFIWFGANQVAAESVFRMKTPAPSTATWSLRIPALLGALPLIACALGQYFSIPEGLRLGVAGAPELGAIGDSAEPKAVKWAASVSAGLIFGTIVNGLLGIALGVVTHGLAKYINIYTRELNEPYFYNKRFLLFAVLLFGGFTFAFIWWPVPLPQLLTVFGVLALFTLCIVAFCLYFSLLTIEYRLPVISALLVFAFMLSILDWNDNHTIRVIVPSENGAQPQLPQPVIKSAAEEFEQWYASRPNLEAYDEYPVYIVAAQGGGMYAAYQTAIFLSRLQDNCPAFRNHLFAISSVSGGSVGAATFVSALKLTEQPSDANNPASPASDAADPCPLVTQYYRAVQQRSQDNQEKKQETDETSAETDEKPGKLEEIVRKTLGTDLLSPLVAATLFPDFGQRFIPWPFPALDRARSLELAFESATSEYDPQDKIRPFADSFLSHWKSSGSTPALFMNATDAGSGRRVLISPFALREANGQSEDGATIQFPFYPKEKPAAKEVSVSKVLDIALSTAAGISARFPWLTPAATIDVSDGRLGSKHRKIRLVDGGYVDNSGVETVLDMLQSTQQVRKDIDDNAKENKKLPDGRPYRKIQINLIVLSGGSYTERSSFALGETMEPIRGLLSARASRAYVAIERAQYVFPEREFKTLGRNGTMMEVKITGLQTASLRNYSYQMPLGWVLSKRTREIIEDQSGYHPDCDPNDRFFQKSPKVPQADCIHLLAYHLLNRSLGSKLADIQQLSVAQSAAPVVAPPTRTARLDQTKMIACYRGKGEKSLSAVQVDSLQELLNNWNQRRELTDDRWLAFILGSIAYETGDFRVQIENMSYRSAEHISRIWRREFPTPASALAYVNNPEALANRIYGKRLGNTEEGDGFRYRGRGMVLLTGRANYRRAGQTIGVDLENDPDLILRPHIGAQVAFAQFLGNKADQLPKYFNDTTEDWAGARKAFLGAPFGVDAVTARSKAFLQCIRESKPGTTVAGGK